MTVPPRDDEPADPDTGGGGLVRLRLDLGYDGTGFAGWARQPGRRTVQGVLEDALGVVLRQERIAVSCAGRTDAGVHARAQVAHADVPRQAYERVAGVLAHRVAGVLPADVGLHDLTVAPDGFDARFSALARRYVYRVSDAPYAPDPLRRHEVLWYRRPLEIDPMDRASARLTGEHDFAAFCRRREGATTVRTLRRLEWTREPDGLVLATVVADAFCHNMVRSLVGAVLAVGDGRRGPDWPAAVLAGRERLPDVHVVAAHGLTLEEVSYPPAAELAARDVESRRLRTGAP